MKGPLVDGRLGKTGVNSSKGLANIEVYNSLNLFFTQLKQEALPFVTRIICDEMGLSTRDDNPDNLVLPPHISKHQCFAQWCYSCRWIVEKLSSAKMIYKPVRDFTCWPHDDDDEVPLWPQGSEYLKVVTWPMFLFYWNRNFPFIKIQKKGADTCTDCQILCNKF